MPIETLIEVAIRESPYLRGKQLRFETLDGHVTLRGNVGSFFHKQMAQETVRRIDGVQRIDNLVVVADRPECG